MEKQLTEKQKQTLAKKNRIYEVAIELFKEYGYDNTSVRDICNMANVTTGTLYNLYENKAAILYCFKEKLDETCHTPLLDEHINIDAPLETITNYIISILHMFDELGAEMTLKIHTYHASIWKQKTESTVLLERFVNKAQNHGTLSTLLDVESTAEAINTIVFGLVYQWCDQNGQYNLIEKGNQLLPLLLKTFEKSFSI